MQCPSCTQEMVEFVLLHNEEPRIVCERCKISIPHETFERITDRILRLEEENKRWVKRIQMLELQIAKATRLLRTGV